MATASKKAFDMSRDGNVYSADPITELCIVGGLELPEEQRGDIDIALDKDHPLFDERIFLPLDEDKVRNVDAYGILVPISIAKVDGIAMVIAGRQRVRWARVVNRRRAARGEPPLKVRATVQRSAPERLIGVMVAENEVRTDDHPMTRLAKAKRMMERGIAPEDCAISFGISFATFNQWLAFDDNATTKVKRAVESGKLPFTAGLTLSRAKDPEKQEAALASLLEAPEAGESNSTKAKKPSVRAARIATKQANGEKVTAGIADMRTQKKLLVAIEKMSHANAGERTLAWWDGVEAALRLVTGDGDIDERLSKVLAEVRK